MTGSLLFLETTQPAPAGYSLLGNTTLAITPVPGKKYNITVKVYRKN
jgi:hypothetical protein